MAIKELLIIILVGWVSTWPRPVLSHARLWDPPGRSTMWRQGHKTPINYQDNELFCGGLSHQISLGYRCGLCGDPYDGKRENEAGGKYAKGIVTRSYRQGQEVTFQVDVTANHKGYFEFKICPTNDPTVKETQECFDLYPLSLTDGSGTKYFIPTKSAVISVNLLLPSDLICDFCVLQWRYHSGNSWGSDKDGRSCTGCGYQEEFYGCADIRILAANSSQSNWQQKTSPRPGGTTTRAATKTDSYNPENSSSTRSNQLGSFSSTVRSHSNKSSSAYKTKTLSLKPGGTQASVEKPSQGTSDVVKAEAGDSGSSTGKPNIVNGDKMICGGVNGQNSLDQWCQLNCQMGFCPETHCTCVSGQYVHKTERQPGCRAAGAFANLAGYDQWCRENCAAGNCPSSVCVC